MNKSNSSLSRSLSNTSSAPYPDNADENIVLADQAVDAVDTDTVVEYDNSDTDYSVHSDNEASSALLRQKGKNFNNMEARNEHQVAKRFHGLSMINTIIGVVVVVLMLIWCTHYRGGFAWHSDIALQFNWHPLLMTIGMVFLYSQSMLFYRMKRYWSKTTLKRVHAGMHIAAFICAVIGLKAVFDFHNYSSPPKANLYSMHSWFGLIAVIFFAGQYVAGFVTFLFPGLSHQIRQMSMPVHVAMGKATFLISVCAVFMGLTEKTLWTLGKSYEELHGEGILVNILACFIGFFAAFTLHLVNNDENKRQPLSEEQIVITEHTE